MICLTHNVERALSSEGILLQTAMPQATVKAGDNVLRKDEHLAGAQASVQSPNTQSPTLQKVQAPSEPASAGQSSSLPEMAEAALVNKLPEASGIQNSLATTQEISENGSLALRQNHEEARDLATQTLPGPGRGRFRLSKKACIHSQDLQP